MDSRNRETNGPRSTPSPSTNVPVDGTASGRRAESPSRRFGRFLPWLRRGSTSARPPSKTTIPREGWYYLFVLLAVLTGAMLREVNLLLLLAGMLLGPLLFNWRLVRATLRGLDARRRMPRGVCAGDLLVVNLDVKNARRKLGSWGVVIEDTVRRESGSGAEEAGRPSVFFSYIPAGQSRTEAYRGRLMRRGRYRLGPLNVSTRFPFGLVRRTLTLGGTDVLYVFPRLGRLAPGWLARRHRAFEGTQRRQQRPSRISGDLYGVREWRHGDSRRWIHWRSSARHGALVVRQFEQHRNRDVAVLVDLWHPKEPREEDHEHVELAVRFAATVVAEVCRQGGNSLLVGTTGAEADCLGGPASMALLEEAMERLAVAAASSDDRLPDLLDRALDVIEPGAEIVLATCRPVDPTVPARFPGLSRDPARRAAARRIRVVDVTAENLGETFQAE